MTLSLISASIRSCDMSSGDNFRLWDISVKVFVKSTNVDRPSSADISRTDRWPYFPCQRLVPNYKIQRDGPEADGAASAVSRFESSEDELK